MSASLDLTFFDLNLNITQTGSLWDSNPYH